MEETRSFKRVLVVITTHNKYTLNGMLDRCVRSIVGHLEVKNNSYSVLVVDDNDSEELESICLDLSSSLGADVIPYREKGLSLGVTQSRIKGFLYAQSNGYEAVSFIDADAYFYSDVDINEFLEDDDIFMCSSYYGYNNGEDGIYTVERYKPGKYSSMEIAEKLVSDDKETRDYNVFMGRFFKVPTVPIDAFVDTKMFCDDSTFFFLYLYYINKNYKGLKFLKVEGLVVSDKEDDVSLPKEFIDVGKDQVKWILNRIKKDKSYRSITDKYQVHCLMFSYLMYTWFLHDLTLDDIDEAWEGIKTCSDIDNLVGINKELAERIGTVSMSTVKFFNDFMTERYKGMGRHKASQAS